MEYTADTALSGGGLGVSNPDIFDKFQKTCIRTFSKLLFRFYTCIISRDSEIYVAKFF